MTIESTKISGLFVISSDKIEDERGHFARLFCRKELKETGVSFDVVQSSVSCNKHAFTLRGMHYQSDQAPEAKIVRCMTGGIWDVAVDLRPSSPSYMSWFGKELIGGTVTGLLIPAGCAHGFLTLTDDATVLYMMDHEHVPESACGVRWNDPAFNISWPAEPLIMSDRDASYGDYGPA